MRSATADVSEHQRPPRTADEQLHSLPAGLTRVLQVLRDVQVAVSRPNRKPTPVPQNLLADDPRLLGPKGKKGASPTGPVRFAHSAIRTSDTPRCTRPCRLFVMVTVDDVRRVARSLPGTTEHLIGDRVKSRVKRLVYVAFSRDETVMGFGFPRSSAQHWSRANHTSSCSRRWRTCVTTGST